MMRMLSSEEARSLLQAARVVRLGCIVNGEPYVVPINCHFEGDSFYSHSLLGLKISGLRENPRACVQVDEIKSDLRWRSAKLSLRWLLLHQHCPYAGVSRSK